MTTSSLITTARTLLSELQDRRTLAIAAGQRPLSDALLLLSCEYETLLGKLLKVYPDTEDQQPEPEYRMLQPGERLEITDETNWNIPCTGVGGWRKIDAGFGIGMPLNKTNIGHYRRRIIPPADMDTLCRFHAEQCGKEQA